MNTGLTSWILAGALTASLWAQFTSSEAVVVDTAVERHAPDCAPLEMDTLGLDSEQRTRVLAMCRACGDETTEIRYFATDELPEGLWSWHRLRIVDALAERIQPFIR